MHAGFPVFYSTNLEQPFLQPVQKGQSAKVNEKYGGNKEKEHGKIPVFTG
jgi:hypothetical protein